jgi:hypothetical protein
LIDKFSYWLYRARIDLPHRFLVNFNVCIFRNLASLVLRCDGASTKSVGGTRDEKSQMLEHWLSKCSVVQDKSKKRKLRVSAFPNVKRRA